jgi:DNA polymerase-4
MGLELVKDQPFQKQRKIIHIDMDCFFAAVEMRDNPELKNVPLAIGGSPTGRGVLSTCNYVARKFGLHSAMSSAQALKLCPHVTFIGGNMSKYKEASEKIREIFHRFTDLVEPLSLDEAYLDVTHNDSFQGSATLIAQEIRRLIKEEIGLTASAGVGPNKFIAKVASDYRKPNGIFVVPPASAFEFAQALPVRKFPGVGKVTEVKLIDLGIHLGSDISKNEDLILAKFGKSGQGLIKRAKGICLREVETEWERKSLSAEKTFSKDLETFQEVQDQLPLIVDEVIHRMQKWKLKKNPETLPYNVFIKLKFSDFNQVTQERSFSTDFFDSVWQKGELSSNLSGELTNLLQMAYLKSEKSVRLIGMGFKFKSPFHDVDEKVRPYQLELFREAI